LFDDLGIEILLSAALLLAPEVVLSPPFVFSANVFKTPLFLKPPNTIFFAQAALLFESV
jgi:hypothetical protein